MLGPEGNVDDEEEEEDEEDVEEEAVPGMLVWRECDLLRSPVPAIMLGSRTFITSLSTAQARSRSLMLM